SAQRTARWGWPDENSSTHPSWGHRNAAPSDGIEYDAEAYAEQHTEHHEHHAQVYDPPSEPVSTAEGPVIEYEPEWTATATQPQPASQEDALVGRVVSHSREGLGEIVSVQGTGKMARLRVLFVSGQEKTVMRRFVRLM
ncbi:MAG: hypothetical protein AAFX99_23495, partial [Myxococcota bacterium]